MDPYEERMAEGWRPLELQTTDVIVRVEDTGQLVNMSALKRRHDPGSAATAGEGDSSSRAGRCAASGEAASSNGSGSWGRGNSLETAPAKLAKPQNASTRLRRTSPGRKKFPSPTQGPETGIHPFEGKRPRHPGPQADARGAGTHGMTHARNDPGEYPGRPCKIKEERDPEKGGSGENHNHGNSQTPTDCTPRPW